jgi:DNA polymerase I-like protein with 3'-5' exonuclease and polymerase domains
MISDYLINGQDKQMGWKLNDVAERRGLGQKHDEVQSYWDKGEDTYDIPDWLLGPYCLQDCHLTLDIYYDQVLDVEERNMWKLIELQNEYTYTLADMEYNGLNFDVEQAQKIINEYQGKADAVLDKIFALIDFEYADKINLGSPQQLSAFLYGGILKLQWKEWTIVEYKTKPYSKYYEKVFREDVNFKGLGFEPDKKRKKQDGYYKVDKDTLATLVSPTAEMRKLKKLLVEYSEHRKVVSTLQGKKGNKGLLSKIQPDGKIHPTLNQTVAATGRLTSSDPNGQNLPRGNTSPVKTCFIPSFDGILQVDLSQIEWRDAAWLSQDRVMIAEINSGVDQHVATVQDLMELIFKNKEDPVSKKNRDHAKVFNFRMIYGGTEWGFYLDINMPSFSVKKWRRIIQDFFEKYSGLKEFHSKCVSFVFRNGYLELPTGRWFKFHKKHIKGEYTYAINQIKNYPVQGMSGGDILPLMAVIIRRGMRKLGLKSKCVLTVHDSIVFDYVDEEKDKLIKLCYDVGNNLDTYIRNYYGLDWNVKLEVECEAGPNYGAIKYIPYEEVI